MDIKPFDFQKNLLLEIVQQNPVIKTVLDNGFVENIDDWYIVAGCLNQTIWNYQNNKQIDAQIKDYDVIYFDQDTSKEKEEYINKTFSKKYKKLLKDKNIRTEFDVVNQARVHIWAEIDWGLKMKPLKSTEEAIASWPATIACVGVRKQNDEFVVVAPYGLTDNFNGIIRPNKTTVMRESDYNYKAEKWSARWPHLVKIDW